MADVEKGAKAPELRYERSSDGESARKSFTERPTVVVFYPRAGSATCNAEIADFSAIDHRFRKIGVDVIAVSPDSPTKLRNFAAKHGTQIELASDPEIENAKRWGTWIEKSMYGRTFLGVERATFLVNSTGHVVNSWRKVRVKGHAQAVLDAAEKLREPE
jgi:thioredoxin-dependent peroxiredoxin